MQWIQAKVSFSDDPQGVIVDLIADVFYGFDAKGVVIDDPFLDTQEGWAADALPRPDQPAVTGYLPVDERLEHRRQCLEQGLVRLSREHGFTYGINYQAIDEEDWAESWKAFFWPRKITPGLVVKPTWRDYAPAAREQIIEIDPGMAFGTGTHPTTVLCIQLLEKHLRPGQSVLDVGTGSGILLIAAAKLGAGRLTGIDLDSMAVAVARKNLVLNQIDPGGFELICGHLVDNITRTFDVVVANILAEVILDLLDDISKVLHPGGRFICSGIIEPLQSGVAEKMASCGFELIEVAKEGDWVALVGRLPQKEST